MEIVGYEVVEARIPRAKAQGSVKGAECKIALNEIKIAADYAAEVEALTIPEDVIKSAIGVEEDYEFSIN